jgi:signal transduction histidine kinase
MERLVEVVQLISLSRDLPGLMKVVRDAAREISGADGATFILRDGNQCFYADENAIAPLWKGRRFPIEACVSGWAMTHKEHVAIEDVLLDERIPQDAYRPTFVKSLLVVPIRTLEPIGAIGTYWATTRRASNDEIRVLQALADTTAVAMENVQVYSELERRVLDRTAELEAALRDLDGFSHSVSHDLRAPVRAIGGFCDLITLDHSALLDTETKRKLGVIKSEALRMGELIDDLLSFSRLGRKALRMQSVDMDALVTRVIDKQRRESGSIVVDYRVGKLPSAVGDASLFEQVWTNLVSNAAKFAGRQPRPTVEIRALDGADVITYIVKDNGVGFDPRYRDKLFQPFQRLHQEADFAGNGIGLALCHRIVTRHGGHMTGESVVGQGATFSFSVPKRPAPMV